MDKTNNKPGRLDRGRGELFVYCGTFWIKDGRDDYQFIEERTA
jgi:hypothetical protein